MVWRRPNLGLSLALPLGGSLNLPQRWGCFHPAGRAVPMSTQTVTPASHPANGRHDSSYPPVGRGCWSPQLPQRLLVHDPARGQHLLLRQGLSDLSSGSPPGLPGAQETPALGRRPPAGPFSRVRHQPQLQAGCCPNDVHPRGGRSLCRRGGHRPCGRSCQQRPPMGAALRPM